MIVMETLCGVDDVTTGENDSKKLNRLSIVDTFFTIEARRLEICDEKECGKVLILNEPLFFYSIPVVRTTQADDAVCGSHHTLTRLKFCFFQCNLKVSTVLFYVCLSKTNSSYSFRQNANQPKLVGIANRRT